MVFLTNLLTNKYTIMSKALELLKSNKDLEQLANEAVSRIERDAKQAFIEPVQKKIENLEDSIVDLSRMSLSVNLNEGKTGISIAEAKKRFTELMETEYQLKLAKKELEIKVEIFNNYFKSASKEA